MLPAISWFDAEAPDGPRESIEGVLRTRAQSHWLTSARATGRMVRDPVYSAVVLAFCQPSSAPARELRRQRASFNIRTGDRWDLFFPGYYQYGSMRDPDQIKLDSDWGFSPRAFNAFRAELERLTSHRWRYTGGADLVIVNTVVMEGDVVTFDFDSVLSGPMTDRRDGSASMTLARVVEAISTDLESGAETPAYGVDRVVSPRESPQRPRSAASEVLVAAAGAVLGEIGARALGLKP